MSETQQKSAVNLPGESLVVVGKTGSENTQPYRPNELEEDSIELHHNRSKAPAVPSFTEELKVKNDESYTIETIEPAEIEAVIEDKPKHQAAKKISSSIKKRDISPEAIILAPIETQIKKTAPVPDIDVLKTSSQTKVDEIQKENVADVESTLGDVIVELRTPEVAKPNPEWDPNDEAATLDVTDDLGDITLEVRVSVQNRIKKFEEDSKLQIASSSLKKRGGGEDFDIIESQPVNMKVRSQVQMLEKKRSLGPYYTSEENPLGGPSGIAICLAKKSHTYTRRCYDNRSGFTITKISKSEVKKIEKEVIDNVANEAVERDNDDTGDNAENHAVLYKMFGAVKGKLDNVRCKITNLLHI